MKSGFVAIIGRSNVGKSTLLNTVIGEKVAITAGKAQTTRHRIQAVYTDERGQIIFLDTPGLHKARNKLGDHMVKVAKRTLDDADVILWVVEPDRQPGRGDKAVGELLEKAGVPVILVVNKMDKVDHGELLERIDTYYEAFAPDEIIPLSALNGKNIERLKDLLFDYFEEGPLYYDADTLTDQSVKQLAAEYVREKAMRFLQEELPHGVTVYVDQMKKRKGRNLWDVDATLVCERASHKGMIIGKQGAMLKKIGKHARADIEQLLDGKVNLKLWVKVRKDWRNDEFSIRDFGYEEK
ncbi:MAG: GTPase Era [Eubacteriales bacterium]|nr:GTPase Era [Eubacteriales bacterium]